MEKVYCTQLAHVASRWPNFRDWLIPNDFVAEDVTPIPEGQVLVVDDLKEMLLVATEH